MRVDPMDGSPIARGIERPRKTVREIINRDLDANDLSINLIYDSTLWHRLIHVADRT